MYKNDPYILVLGASIVDIIGFSRRKYNSRDSIPGNIKISLGGVCRNIAENLARVNVNTSFISVLGGDDQGKNILNNSKEIGYNLAIEELGLEPMLNLGMRLGEGSGCPIAFSVVEFALSMMNNMATFEEGEIDNSYLEKIKGEENYIV